MKTYREYTQECRLKFLKEFPDNRPLLSPYDLRMHDYRPDEKSPFWEWPKEWNEWVGAAAEKFKKLIEDPNEQYEDPTDSLTAVSYSKDLMTKLKDPWKIPELSLMADALIPQIEKTVYGTNILVTHIHAYRNIPVENGESKRNSSFKFHLDNDLIECNKIMVYLSDVKSVEDGPFSLLRDKDTKQTIKLETTRIDHANIRPSYWPQNRIPQEVVDGCLARNCEEYHILGKSGTTLLFDNNIFHRANPCAPGHYRDVVIFKIKPWINEITPKLQRDKTRGWEGTSPIINPEAIASIK